MIRCRSDDATASAEVLAILVFAGRPLMVDRARRARDNLSAMTALPAAVDNLRVANLDRVGQVKSHGAGVTTAEAPMLDDIGIDIVTSIDVFKLLPNFVVARLG